MKPVAIPELAVTVYAGSKVGKAAPIDTNYVITCYHTVKGSTNITVMNYPAKLVYFDENKDTALLETEHTFEDFYTIEGRSNMALEYLDSYSVGDSGMPILDRGGNLVRMLVGQRVDGTIADVSLRDITEIKEELIDEKNKAIAADTLPDVSDNELFNSVG